MVKIFAVRKTENGEIWPKSAENIVIFPQKAKKRCSQKDKGTNSSILAANKRKNVFGEITLKEM